MPSSLLTREEKAPAAVRQPGTRSSLTGTLRTRRERALADADSLLWSPAIVTRWAGIVGVGVVVVLCAWYTAAGKSDWLDQRVAMSVGIAALVLVNLASVTLLVAGRRVVGMRRVELLGDLPLLSRTAEPVAQVVTSGPVSEVLVAADGLLRYHRSDCPLTSGRSYPASDRATHHAAGRMACGVCRP